MTKREKVIDSLERCTCHVPDACRDCAYDDKPAPDCWLTLERDTLELLKEREPVKPIICFSDGTYAVCGNCRKQLVRWKSYQYSFCPRCGTAVRWDE